jgi:hypothetical protein
VLANSGVSQVSGPDGKLQQSIRPPDGLPITEFDISSGGMNVFGLPGATLMQFEGGGMETTWQIELPVAANPGGFAGLADALVTFDLRARFAPSALQSATGQPLAPKGKTIDVLRPSPEAGRLGRPAGSRAHRPPGVRPRRHRAAGDREDAHRVQPLRGPGVRHRQVERQGQAGRREARQDHRGHRADGVAFSNSPPITDPLSTAPLSPLNALTGVDATQKFSLQIDKAANPGVDFSKVNDVVLGVDYTATF